MKDNSIRLGLLFKEAGFITSEYWKTFLEKIGLKKKQLTEVLKQEASLRSFIDLATVEISLPFSKPKSAHIPEVLNEPLPLTDEDLADLLSAFSVDLKGIVSIFVAEGYANKDAAEQVLADHENMPEQGMEMFVRQNIITPDFIAKYLGDPNNPISKNNRIEIALEILVFNKILNKQAASKISNLAKEESKDVASLLKSEGSLSDLKLIDRIKKGLYLPEVKLNEVEIDNKCLEFFPVDFLRKHLFLPFKVTKHTLHVAVSDPLNTYFFDAISLLTNRTVLPSFATQGDLIYKLNVLYAPKREKSKQESTEKARAEQDARSTQAPPPRKEPTTGISTLVDNVSTVQLVSSLIESAITTRATDIHLEPQHNQMRARFRIDGSLHNIMTIPATMQLPVISRIKVLSNMDVTERRRPQDGHFSFSIGKSNFDLRISSIPTHLGEKIVIRILDESTVLKGLRDLGFESNDRDKLQRLIRKPYGMILVTGPTGSGKTSTLYASLSEINQEDINIITIEDPVEYQLPGINQMQVDTHIDLTFASGLRSILRQDPDIIMVGEIRDTETAQIAIRAALTGHLVFSTLHTNTSVGAITALMHMGIKPFMIASSLIGIISQRLVKKVCPHCKTQYQAQAGVLRDLGLNPRSKRKLSKGKGCDECLQTGYFGRIGVFELVEINSEIREIIIDNPNEQAILKAAKEHGLESLADNGVKKVTDGIASAEEVIRAIYL